MFHFLVPFMCAGCVPEGRFGLIVWYLLLTQVPLSYLCSKLAGFDFCFTTCLGLKEAFQKVTS